MLTTVLPWLLKVSPSDLGSSPSPLTDPQTRLNSSVWQEPVMLLQRCSIINNLAALVPIRWSLSSKRLGLLHYPYCPQYNVQNWSRTTLWSQDRKFFWISYTSPSTPNLQTKGDIYPSLGWFNCSGGYPRQFRIQTNFQISKPKCNCRDNYKKPLK